MNKKSSLLKQLDQLKKEIKKHDDYYYNWDKPQITDWEYDQLLQKLQKIESQYPELKSPDSPTQKLPGRPLPHFKQKKHTKAMLSLQNSYSIEDIKAFYQRACKALNTEKLSFFLEPKLDGMAVELIYKEGLFSQALSRGDGNIGEDITAQVKTIRNLPLSLQSLKNTKKNLLKKTDIPPLLELRGELMILKTDFEKINQEQESNGQPLFANPRNLVAGSVRQLDPKITASRPLKLFIHSMGGVEIPFLKSQSEFSSFIQAMALPGFRVAKKLVAKKLKAPLDLCQLAYGLKDLISYYQDMQKIRLQLPFEIDGIVIKLNDFEQQKQWGEIATSPRWAMAGKFTPEQGETLLEKIKLQVGRTGVITPVAVLKPIKIGGVSIRHASLHNFKLLEKKDIREGDKVLLHRAGDVIPEIIKSLSRVSDKKLKASKKLNRAKKFKAPTKCPVCKNPVKEQGDYLLCDFPHCPAVIENKLIHFASKKAMNIEFLGEKSLKAFYEWGWLKNYSDIYDLKDKPVAKKEGFGKKSYQLLLESLQKSQKSSLSRLIFALGIPLVGEQTAKSLSQFVYEKHQKPDLELKTACSYLKKLSLEDLESIEDIGPLVSQSFKSAFENPALIKDLEGLSQRGVHFAPLKVLSQTLKGLSFVITGTLPVPREDLKRKIEAQGGKVLSQVSSKTQFLIVGDNPGSKKEKAQSRAIPILSYEAFLARFF